MMKKITFLVPAYNEEKLIRKSLDSLIRVQKDWENMEILVGLDSCTDKTPDIVKELAKKHKFIRFFELEEGGKQQVLDKLNPHIKGDIVFIHDADWVLEYKDKEKFEKFIGFFDDEKVGGIANWFTADFFPEEMLKIKSLGFLASSWGNHFLNEYIKKTQTKRKGELVVIDKEKMIFPFFLDVYRKKALDKTQSKKELRAGDHLERTLRLLNSGYDVVVPEDMGFPRGMVIYRVLSVKDFLKQRVRGMISKRKIKGVYKQKMKLGVLNFHILFFLYTFFKLGELSRFRDVVAMFIYWYGIFYGMFMAKIQESASVKKVWEMRALR